MKIISKKIKYILLAIVLISGLLVLTGCGNGNNIVNQLNNAMQQEIAGWKDQGYARTLTMTYLQGCLDSNYVIVASGETEFTSSPEITKYQEGNVPNYDGSSYSITRMMEQAYNVNYMAVLDNSTGKYYNIKISYENTDLNGIEKEYPVFSDAKEIK